MTPRRLLAIAAAVAGVLAAFAGSPSPKPGLTVSPAGAAVDVARLAAAVAHEDDHVTALELAQWIRDRKPGLRIVDLRTAAEYETYHLPRAENLAIESAVSAAFGPEETVVLISGGGAHAAQGWVLLETLGHRNVYFLRGGIGEWIDDVMNPTMPADASPKAIEAFRRARELSLYFGGVPRRAPAEAAHGDAAALRRRGC